VIEDQPTILWSLERDGREVACRVKLVPYGIEVHLTSNGETVITRVFETGDEALAWAEKKRGDREAAGWKKPAGEGSGRPGG
jgi:hypothetical protein